MGERLQRRAINTAAGVLFIGSSLAVGIGCDGPRQQLPTKNITPATPIAYCSPDHSKDIQVTPVFTLVTFHCTNGANEINLIAVNGNRAPIVVSTSGEIPSNISSGVLKLPEGNYGKSIIQAQLGSNGIECVWEGVSKPPCPPQK